MEAVATSLRDRVVTNVPRLRAMCEAKVAYKPAANRWSKKEILGHLIDSACNNHQRFVRAQLSRELSFPGYEQERWVQCQGYAVADWQLLIDLWSAYNRRLADVIDQLPPAALSTSCQIGGGEAVTLARLIEDYLRHLDHHLIQLDRAVPICANHGNSSG